MRSELRRLLRQRLHEEDDIDRDPERLRVKPELPGQRDKVLGWPRRCKLVHAFLWEYSELQNAEVGPTPGPTRRLSHLRPSSPGALQLPAPMAAAA